MAKVRNYEFPGALVRTALLEKEECISVYDTRGNLLGTTSTDSVESFKFVFTGNMTIVILPDGTEGRAYCRKGDVFNPEVGLGIAHLRAKIAQMQKELSELTK